MGKRSSKIKDYWEMWLIGLLTLELLRDLNMLMWVSNLQDLPKIFDQKPHPTPLFVFNQSKSIS